MTKVSDEDFTALQEFVERNSSTSVHDETLQAMRDELLALRAVADAAYDLVLTGRGWETVRVALKASGR